MIHHKCKDNGKVLTRYLPEGYTLEGSDCIIRDGYVYVSVAPAEEVQNVKINYYDEAAKKQVAESTGTGIN